ncbi:Putative oxidoreductase, aldo/keto reductase family [Acidilobus saccharovorans 345-15]|uniref:Putative oxidoreductase, aldo/keto reductase family n=1 Tax=Acidilobus saccharovorans (strain DSM 16705 / JCM 18335 / VKM B-2471 / 345-15) TaxID=666510 RepID=D9Q243_ACIS3|nr:aldo/keto reductase [Acidilobus saccharovorans]ADL19381.1 Putative oxidoreductase, aldo/keto reductase family [Acidilobus saccharovorans 345-15]
MIYVKLGKGGPKVSAIGLGFWEIGSTSWRGSEEVSVNIVRAAVNNGISFFDTAEVYGMGRSERSLGNAVKTLGLRPDDIVVATKVAGFRPLRWLVAKAAEASARRLGLRPSLLQLHWPPPAWVPLCEPLRGLEDAAKRGLTEFIGVSNFPGHMLEEAASCLRSAEIVSDQVEYSLAFRTPELDVFRTAEKLGIGIIAYSPLAKGALAGAAATRRIQRMDPRFRAASRDLELQEALTKVAASHGVTKAQVALSWIVGKGAVPIPGTTKPERVAELAGSAELRLADDELSLLDKASSKYVSVWGRGYSNLRALRFIPCGLQYLGVKVMGGA